MGIAEKRVPLYLSIAASISATLVTGWLWLAGAENPRRYHSNMAINKHNEYSAFLNCYDCHVPDGSTLGLFTSLNCLTSGCHGEMATGISYEEAIAIKMDEWGYYPDARERIEHYLDLHIAFEGDSCASCHTEHQRATIRVPEGWTRYQDRTASSSWKSIREVASASTSTDE